MPPTYEHYRSAAQVVRRGWAQNTWHDEDGNPCMLQAVIDAMGYREEAIQLPMHVQLELDSQLMLTASYCTDRDQRRKRRKALRKGLSLQQFIFGWNDTAGRTKDEVADVLDALADRLEMRHLSETYAAARRSRGISWRELETELDSLWDELAPDQQVLTAV